MIKQNNPKANSLTIGVLKNRGAHAMTLLPSGVRKRLQPQVNLQREKEYNALLCSIFNEQICEDRVMLYYEEASKRGRGGGKVVV